ncbi:hypothetical protein MNBD_GAMMA08-701 [hydrothermal vent metagenome]|uniref:Uncharacterized protein n=1 Tax=hydrothermal vent metagenome TaxID=652676 RepID=A0A3B0XJ85_9ZZZZ
MKNMVNKILLLIILQSCSTFLHAEEVGYEVELIIFEDATGRYFNSEDWSYNDFINNKEKTPSKTNNTKTNNKQAEVDPEFSELEWDNAKLATNLKRLKNNSNFRVLAVKRWKQTGLDRKNAFDIPIGNNVSKKTEDKDNSENVTENKDEAETADEINTPQQTEPYLTGSVKLIMSRYLHFNVDMKYIKPQLNESGEYNNIVIPILNERRMRSREIHYIDHPLVGVVVLATPYKIKTEEDNVDTSEYKTM